MHPFNYQDLIILIRRSSIIENSLAQKSPRTREAVPTDIHSYTRSDPLSSPAVDDNGFVARL